MRPPTTGSSGGGTVGQTVMFADQLVQHHHRPHHHHSQSQPSHGNQQPQHHHQDRAHYRQHQPQPQHHWQQQAHQNGHESSQRATAQIVQNFGYYEQPLQQQRQNGHSTHVYGVTDNSHHNRDGHLQQHHPVGSPPAQRCQCCPFGYHIDLGFVKFAEDVAAGKEQIQNWSSPAKKRARRLMASPSSERTLIADLSDSDPANISLPSSQPYNDNSSLLMSKSLDVDELPDLAEHSQYHQQHARIAQSSTSPYTVMQTTTTNGRPRAPSAPVTVQQNIQHKKNPAYLEWETTPKRQFPYTRTAPMPINNNNTTALEGYQPELYHHHGQQQHQSRFYEAHVQQQREQHKRQFPHQQILNGPERQEQNDQLLSSVSPYPVGSPLRTSTPKSLNDELKQILLMQQRQQNHQQQSHPLHISTTMPSHYNIDRHVATNGTTNGSASTTSAPSSPIPRRLQQHHTAPYQTSIAQSMAQLKKTPQKALATATWGSTPQAHTSLSALSSAARNVVINPPTPASLTPQQQHHYLESGRRRVLSPEPRLLSSQFPVDNGGDVRSSNMQNRAFFHQNHGNSQSNLTNGIGVIPSEIQNVSRVPYRTRGATSAPQKIGNTTAHSQLAASSVELTDFASVVRRRRLDADLGGGSSTMLHSAHLVRSLSPPAVHYSHGFSSPSSGTPTTASLPRQQQQQQQTAFSSLSMANLQAYQQQQERQQSYEYDEENNGTLKATKATKMARNQFAHIPTQLPQSKNAELRTFATQTEMETKKRPTWRDVGILTEHQKFEKIQHEFASKKQKEFKEIGTSPAMEFPMVINTLTSPVDELPFHGLITYNSIAVDTRDLPGHTTSKSEENATKIGKQKAPPPAPPPKPTGPDVEAELRRRRQHELLGTLVTEFQYCVGHEPEYRPGEEPALPEKLAFTTPETVDRGVDAIFIKPIMNTVSTSTTDLVKPTPAKVEIGIGTPQRHFADIGTETDEEKSPENMTIGVQTESEEKEALPEFTDIEIQTEIGWLEAEIDRRLAEAETERREKRKRNSVERSTETDEDDAPDQFIMITCNKCEQRSSVASDELFEKIIVPANEEEMEMMVQQEQRPMEIVQLPPSSLPPPPSSAPLFLQQQTMPILETLHEEEDHFNIAAQQQQQHFMGEEGKASEEGDDDEFEDPIGRKIAVSAEPHGLDADDKLMRILKLIGEEEEAEVQQQQPEILEVKNLDEIEPADQKIIEEEKAELETIKMLKEMPEVPIQELRRATTEIHSTILFLDETAKFEEEKEIDLTNEHRLSHILLQNADEVQVQAVPIQMDVGEKPTEHDRQPAVIAVEEHSLIERRMSEEVEKLVGEAEAPLDVLAQQQATNEMMATTTATTTTTQRESEIAVDIISGPDELEQKQQQQQVEREQQSNVQACSPLSSDEGLVLAEEEEEFAVQESRMLPELEFDADRISIETDVQTVIFVEAARGNHSAAASAVGPLSSSSSTTMSSSKTSETLPAVSARTEALRKLLTEPQMRQPFQRDSDANRSYRSDKGKGQQLDIEYIAERHKSTEAQQSEPSTPCGSSSAQTRKALKETISLKKSPPPSVSSPPPGTSANITLPPDPIPARIPRPKIARYSPNVAHAETPDEEEEVADRLTPLRSEMRSLAAWGGSTSPRLAQRSLIFRTQIEGPVEEEDEDDLDAFERANCSGTTATGTLDDSASSTSSEGARTYDMSDDENADYFELSNPLRDALETINEFLLHGAKMSTKGAESEQKQQQNKQIDWAFKYAQHEWLKMSTRKNANAILVEQFIDALESYSVQLMDTVLNMTDPNGNTALHYAVSNENFDVISVLLDSKVCRVDRMNKAGYSALMLGALCELRDETECAIMQRLFQMGDVNAKAVKHAQTALMLAASHGRVEATNLLLKCGADVNIQDVDGSTALMCAAEHGQKEIVKILLKQPSIDASLTDCDNQTALSIAVENQHRDIGVLIYAHLNFSRLTETSGDNSVTI